MRNDLVNRLSLNVASCLSQLLPVYPLSTLMYYFFLIGNIICRLWPSPWPQDNMPSDWIRTMQLSAAAKGCFCSGKFERPSTFAGTPLFYLNWKYIFIRAQTFMSSILLEFSLKFSIVFWKFHGKISYWVIECCSQFHWINRIKKIYILRQIENFLIKK